MGRARPRVATAVARTLFAIIVPAVAATGTASLVACSRGPPPAHELTLFFRGDPVANIAERVTDEVGGRRRVERRARLAHAEEVTLEAVVDAAGTVQEARYRRGGRREVRLVDGRLTDVLRGSSREIAGDTVLLELLRFAQPARATEVALLDLASGEAVRGRLERQGPAVVALDEAGGLIARVNVEGLRTGPGAFFEGDTPPSLDTAPVELSLAAAPSTRGLRLVGVDEAVPVMKLEGPGQRPGAGGTVVLDVKHSPKTAPTPADRSPTLFIESDAEAVRAFAARTARAGDPLVDAVALVGAIHPLVDAARSDEPPSALGMLTSGGDCDGAAALLTASLRALGHAAHPVVGYRRSSGDRAGRFVPHAWVEVYTREGWLLVDATAPRVGSDGTHLKLFEGLGSALTMGRVLGRLRLEPVP